MMNEFIIKLADLNILIRCRHEKCLRLCQDYLTFDAPDFTVYASDEEIMREGKNEGYPEDYLESLCIYRQIAERLPEFNRFVFHGAAVTYRERGYLFTAPSGTGKSTHISLWKRYLGADVDLINGDKPVLAIVPDGVRVYGTPWAGKENWQKNRSALLNGVCFLEQGRENSVRALCPEECVPRLIRQTYLPAKERAAGLTLELLDRLAERVPFLLLRCDRSEEAVRCSFEGLTGLPYEKIIKEVSNEN